jgi:hypothetical protein
MHRVRSMSNPSEGQSKGRTDKKRGARNGPPKRSRQETEAQHLKRERTDQEGKNRVQESVETGLKKDGA